MRRCFDRFFLCVGLLFFCVALAVAQSSGAALPPPEISADLGPCFALVRVTGLEGKPVYAAKVSTRIQYGALGVKKLDLEAFTGQDGQIKLNNLPQTARKPIYIHVSKDDKEEMVEFKPNLRCHATFDVELR